MAKENWKDWRENMQRWCCTVWHITEERIWLADKMDGGGGVLRSCRSSQGIMHANRHEPCYGCSARPCHRSRLLLFFSEQNPLVFKILLPRHATLRPERSPPEHATADLAPGSLGSGFRDAWCAMKRHNSHGAS